MANILAFRDQENLTHAHHTTAAAKPLNQGVRALQPKTPGNFKTPFRPAQNNENVPLRTIGKGGTSKLDKNVLATHFPQARAPLGAKTTNAKAFQTPAPLTGKSLRHGRQLSASARRSNKSKIVVAQSEPVEADVLSHSPEEEPDYGYAPPPSVEIPDIPVDLQCDPDLTEALTRADGVLDPYESPRDERGAPVRVEKEECARKAVDLAQSQKTSRESNKPVHHTLAELNKQVDDMIVLGRRKKRTPFSRANSTEARSAVAALSESDPHLPSVVNRPTKASEQKKRTIAVLNDRPSRSSESQDPNRSNHVALSKNTIGFPKARKAPSILPRAGAMPITKTPKVDQRSIHPRDFRDLYGSPPEESDMWFRLKQYELLGEDTAVDKGTDHGELFDGDFFPFDNAKLDDEDFQLPLPEQ
jgi:hypothetical protein